MLPTKTKFPAYQSYFSQTPIPRKKKKNRVNPGEKNAKKKKQDPITHNPTKKTQADRRKDEGTKDNWKQQSKAADNRYPLLL
jgi:hypothetical protein